MADDQRSPCCPVATEISESSDQPLKGASTWLRSGPARIAAVGFILLILMGNFWVAQALIGARYESWVGLGFGSGVIIVLIGMVALAARGLLYWWRQQAQRLVIR